MAAVCSYVQSYEPDNPATHGGRNLERMTMRQLYEAFGLLETTIDFVVRSTCWHDVPTHQRRIQLCRRDDPASKGLPVRHYQRD